MDQARAHAGLFAASWAESISSGVTLIKASHITELRARLAEARAALGLSAASYTDPNLTIGDSIKAHIQELRGKTNETITAGGAGGIDVEWLVGWPSLLVQARWRCAIGDELRRPLLIRRPLNNV